MADGTQQWPHGFYGPDRIEVDGNLVRARLCDQGVLIRISCDDLEPAEPSVDPTNPPVEEPTDVEPVEGCADGYEYDSSVAEAYSTTPKRRNVYFF